MITFKLLDSNFLFYWDEEPLPFEQWPVASNALDSMRYSILKEKLSNGMGERTLEGVVLTAEELYASYTRPEDLDDILMWEYLGFPPLYTNKIYIKGNGPIPSANFKFEVIFCFEVTSYDVVIEKYPLMRVGCVLINAEHKPMYRLSFPQFQVLQLIDEFNARSSNQRSLSKTKNWEDFAVIKKLAHEAKIVFSKLLENENVYKPEIIGMDFQKDENTNTISVLPKIKDQEIPDDLNIKFQHHFKESNQTLDIYTAEQGFKSTRIVLSAKQRKAIKTLKEKLQKVPPQEIETLIQKPLTYFDPLEQEIDLSDLYSDRVIEIGIYKPKVYPFIKEYKSEWFPGLKIEDAINGKGIIELKTEKELRAFQKAIEEAKKANRAIMEWEGIPIPLQEAEQFLELAQSQFRDPSIPNSSQKKVLIIKENAVDLEYVEEHTAIIESFLFEEVPQFTQTNAKLKKHQQEGIGWLQGLFTQKQPGCLLADEMGLGKTLQILYFLEWLASKREKCLFLVVTPVGLLENWLKEHRTYFPNSSLKITLIHAGLQDIQTLLATAQESAHQLVLMNYETLRNYQLLICALDYTIVVLDEAQRIKTPGRLTTNAAKALKAEFKVAVTGTPVENSYHDLWCIMDFTNPGLLGHAKQFALEFGLTPKNIKSEEEVVRFGRALRKRIGTFMLRRLKSEILIDLPPKYSSENPCPEAREWFSNFKLARYMPERQKTEYIKAYSEIRSKPRVVLKGQKQQKGEILQVIKKLKFISDHPFLYKKELMESKGSQI
ncbi:MAG: SNF2-related protein, partial [Bacteroidales bacterium]